jgi:hypothetical protein
MSVTAQTPYKSFTAAPGATLFSTDFRVILAADLVVRKDGVVQSSGFTLSGLGNPSGVDVTFGVPMVGGEFVELQRSVPLVRATDYQQTGDFLSPVVNIDFDRLWMALQDSQFLSNLAILLPVGDPLAPMSIPDVATRANKFMAFDALGQAIAAAGAAGVPVSAFMATLLDDIDAAAARTTLGLSANGSSLVTAANYAAMRTLLGLVIGTDVLAPNGNGSALTALNGANISSGDIAQARIATALNASGSAPLFACRAWMVFNGSGTPAIRGSGNVSSITDLGVGAYRMNFTTSMPSINYSWSFGGNNDGSNNAGILTKANITPVVGSFDFIVGTTAGAVDTTYACVQIFH